MGGLPELKPGQQRLHLVMGHGHGMAMAWPWHGWGTYCSGFFYANQPRVDANSSASRFSRAPGLECIKSKKAMTLNYNSFYNIVLPW